MKRFLRVCLWVAFFGGALGLLGGFAGTYHPAADSIAVFRLYALLAVAISLAVFALSKRRFMAAVSAAILVSGIISLRPNLLSPAPVEGLSLLQSNMQFKNDARQLVDYVKTNAPDIITLQEITTRSIPQLAQLRGLYPYQVVCPFAAVGGVAILSKFRMKGRQGEGCLEGQGMVSAQLETPLGDITVVSLHLHWPWPYRQATQLEALIPALNGLQGPVVVGGDFNMVPWATPIEKIGEATNTRVIAGLRFSKSLLAGFVQLPIDQVMVSNGWLASAETGPQLGSDHNAILARFVPVHQTQ